MQSYVLLVIFLYLYVPVRTSMYRHAQISKSTVVRTGMYYQRVRTGTYRYIPVRTAKNQVYRIPDDTMDWDSKVDRDPRGPNEMRGVSLPPRRTERRRPRPLRHADESAGRRRRRWRRRRMGERAISRSAALPPRRAWRAPGLPEPGGGGALSLQPAVPQPPGGDLARGGRHGRHACCRRGLHACGGAGGRDGLPSCANRAALEPRLHS
jgi:hypothetical protein